MSMKAVLVGINKYAGNNALKGCVNDVLVTRDILRIRHSVLEQDIRMVVDERATKDAILERLEWLISQSGSTNNLLFHYSGHGAQIPNKNYAADKELDGLDEVLCPVDFSWEKSQWILDDEINAIISKKEKNCRLVMLFDCCHSGTVFRSAINASDAIYDIKPRAIDTPIDLMSRIPQFNVISSIPIEGQGSRFWGFDEKPIVTKPTIKQKESLTVTNTIVLSACSDYQTAADANFKTRDQGAFSYCLQKFLYQNPDMTIRELEDSTIRYMKSFGFSQNPEFRISGGADTRRLIIT